MFIRIASILSWHIVNIQDNQQKIQGMEKIKDMEEVKKYFQDKGMYGCIAKLHVEDCTCVNKTTCTTIVVLFISKSNFTWLIFRAGVIAYNCLHQWYSQASFVLKYKHN